MHLVYLLSYSPDLNPIKQSFMALKAWMRTYNDLIKEYKRFEDFLELSLKHFAKSGDPDTHFRSAATDYSS